MVVTVFMIMVLDNACVKMNISKEMGCACGISMVIIVAYDMYAFCESLFM